MNDHTRSPFEVDQAIRASAGMGYINREHGRSFSLNIFRTNARELIEALRHVSDPEHGLRLMMLQNKEAGTQAHREVARRVHNFVAAAKTLVDHTRVFVESNYENSTFHDAYKQEVDERFTKNGAAKFVHELRNYMLHRGMPNSAMFLNFSQNPERPDLAGQITTGVRLDARELRDWDRWTAPARAYLDTMGDEVSIEALVSAYVSEVEEFQIWISDRLAKFHAADLAELEALREEYAVSELEHEGPRVTKIEEAIPHELGNVAADPFSFPSPIENEVNRLGEELLGSIRELVLSASEQGEFRSDRPIGATLTSEEFVEQPIVWKTDVDGNQVIAFILKDSKAYGFDIESIKIFQKLTGLILRVPWASRSLSEKFAEGMVIAWCRSSFGSVTTTSLTEAITSASRVEVKAVDVWAPIAHLEVESGFSFGPVEILPITATMIDELEATALKSAPEQEADVRGLFDKLRSTMQGYAAVVVRSEAVGERAGIDGLAIAREAVDLLRFFSPASSDVSSFCPTALLGGELVPTSHVLVLGDGSFSYSERVIPTDVAYWRMSRAKLTKLRQAFDMAGALLRKEYLDEFESAVRSSMILFGTAATCRELSDRLVYTLSAMEGVLIKHELEAAAYSVEERMAKLLTTDEVKPEEIAHNVRAIYRLRARHGSLQWTDFDREVLQEFVLYARRLLLIALQNIASFGTRAEFVEAIERTAYV